MTKSKGTLILKISGIIMMLIAAIFLFIQASQIMQGLHTIFDSEAVVSVKPGGDASEVFRIAVFELLSFLATFISMFITGLLCFRNSTKPEKAMRLILLAVITLALLVLYGVAAAMLEAILWVYLIPSAEGTPLVIAALGLPVLLGLIGAIRNKQQKTE